MTLNFGDKGNRLARIVDANGHTTQFGYNTQSRLPRITDGESHTTQLHYQDQLLSRLRLTYDTTFEYDARQRLTTTTQHANQTQYTARWRYDASKPLATVDAKAQTTESTYDALPRLNTTDANGGVTTFFYDARSNLIQVTDAEQRHTYYTCTLRNQVATESQHEDNTDGAIRYQYNENGDLIRRQSPDGSVVTYDYNAANRLILASIRA